MRAQVIPFVFLVLLVGGTILGYIFYNSFYGTSYEGSISERYTIDVLRNELERAKGYLKQSLIYSSHQSLREHACLSGQVGAMEWICNEPNTYSPDDSKGCLEKYTLYYENNYLNNYSILGLPITFTKKNFSSCVYGVDESGVFSGKYDEGDFWVNITGAALAVSGGSAAASEDVNLNT
ncbi:MAG: hypothetical protein KAU95_01710, partial [Candidatus Aenigmarchaeota archaeon]|nr:hypothetical protein [Candidatus Aenigmarchaeota archaeon]